MSDLIAWLQNHTRKEQVPLFQTDDNGVVEIKFRGQANNPILLRHPKMEEAVIRLVEENISDPRWEGLLYMMVWQQQDTVIPLYIGKAERKGVSNEISANIMNIAANKGKFARWGDALYYHIGDLSQAVFVFPAKRKPLRKYKRWAEALFVEAENVKVSPEGKTYRLVKLKDSVNLILIPWFEEDYGPSKMPCSLPSVEKEIIGLASIHFPQHILNKDGT